MRLAGVEGAVAGGPVSELPGAERAIVSLVRGTGARALQIEFGDRVLGYRTIGLGDGAIVFVEDITEARRREQEIKVKEATIREVHHRVKNNLQTIASLLRIQGRRSESEDTRRALSEAMERVSAMAVVHELLAGSTEEKIDFMTVAESVVEMIRRGLAGDNPGMTVEVSGRSGMVPAQVATSLALVVAELVHNAIEHGLSGCQAGSVRVNIRRLPGEMVLAVRDTGTGVPEGFDAGRASNLGLAIVRTLVEDDLRGTIAFGSGRGTTVTVRFPLPKNQTEE
jgi:two-component sensor histidine kinase